MTRTDATESPDRTLSGADRRTAERVHAEIDVTYESENNFFKGFSEDISEGGLFLATHVPPKVGQTMTIKFTLPGVDRPIVTEAEVRWSREMNPASDTPPGVGLRFVTLSEEDRNTVERFVNHRDPLFFED